jgi:hypothetical protein
MGVVSKLFSSVSQINFATGDSPEHPRAAEIALQSARAGSEACSDRGTRSWGVQMPCRQSGWPPLEACSDTTPCQWRNESNKFEIHLVEEHSFELRNLIKILRLETSGLKTLNKRRNPTHCVRSTHDQILGVVSKLFSGVSQITNFCDRGSPGHPPVAINTL